MPDTIEKLRPDRDLQCYFFQPSAIAALSEASSSGFVVSGTWRQQFDWAVIEWNRDNVFEHPAFRCLPDGDLGGLTLTYEETRTNCIPMDSVLFPTVDWPYVRIWAETPPTTTGGLPVEKIFYVALNKSGESHAEPIDGSYATAYADFTLSGTAIPGETVGLAYIAVNYTYTVQPGDSLADIVEAIANGMNFGYSPDLKAVRTGETIRVYYTAGVAIADSVTGVNGNRFAMYSYSSGSAVWDSLGQTFAHGTSPTKWRVTLDFTTLQGRVKDLSTDTFGALESIPTDKIRKIRWTYSSDLQPVEFVRSEFKVVVSNWTVTGTGRPYKVAGPTSRRIEDTALEVSYSEHWSLGRGNYSGGMIHFTNTPGESISIGYSASTTHDLYLGTRYTNNGALIQVSVDGGTSQSISLYVAEEDVLIRKSLGTLGTGDHTVIVTHDGSGTEDLYFDFLELAVPSTDLPTFPSITNMTLATDWDTDHSLALAPERTAWFIYSLGFHGRQNHYVGALLFYELHNPDNRFATGTVTFSGSATSGTVTIRVGPSAAPLSVSRSLHANDTADTIALCFAQELSRGYTGIWASAAGGVLTIQSRKLGADSGLETLEVDVPSGITGTLTDPVISVGVDGTWLTDLTASPRLNRAARDWMESFFTALVGYGIDAVSAFSTELKHGDRSVGAGIAQRDSAGNPILLPTPSLQTNFSPTSLGFWRQVHADCADVMASAGLQPYLQLGEVQWWYFPNDGREESVRLNFSSMPYYDAYTASEFLSRYGRAMTVFLDNDADPASYPDEVAFLSDLLGEFTDGILSYVLASHPTARFEVLYPYDVNHTAFNHDINFPVSSWTPTALTCLKTEGFGFTFGKNLDMSEQGIDLGGPLGFPATQRSHLVGLGDSAAPWLKEARMASGKGFESVVLFALDQFCLIGYPVPLPASARRAIRLRG